MNKDKVRRMRTGRHHHSLPRFACLRHGTRDYGINTAPTQSPRIYSVSSWRFVDRNTGYMVIIHSSPKTKKMNKQNNSLASFTASVTQQIITELEKGTAVWKQPWENIGNARNYCTKRPYSGFNQFYLSWICQQKSFQQPFFLTYKQALELGGHVRKGEKGITIVYWKKRLVKKDIDNDNERPQTRLFPFLHTVLHVSQIENIEFSFPEAKQRTLTPNQQCQEIIASMPNPPAIFYGGNEAYYSVTLDYVRLPLQQQFFSTEDYYKTAFHELIHSTGHNRRLGRFKPGQSTAPFGSADYSKEELVAEIGAAMLCASAGITTKMKESADYIAGWLKALRNDHMMIFSAANKAAKAVNYIVCENLCSEEAHTVTEEKQHASL